MEMTSVSVPFGDSIGTPTVLITRLILHRLSLPVGYVSIRTLRRCSIRYKTKCGAFQWRHGIGKSKGALGMQAPPRPNTFIFMQFLVKILSNNKWHSTSGVGSPPCQGYLGSVTENWHCLNFFYKTIGLRQKTLQVLLCFWNWFKILLRFWEWIVTRFHLLQQQWQSESDMYSHPW